MQWSDLKRLKDVEPFNDDDLECLAEVREVLKKHGKRERFGVALLHKHFEMDDNELLLENSDEETRELSIKPVQRESAENSVPTIVMLLDDENRCVQSCSGRDVDDPKPCA
jgi:hypothetical protein